MMAEKEIPRRKPCPHEFKTFGEWGVIAGVTRCDLCGDLWRAGTTGTYRRV